MCLFEHLPISIQRFDSNMDMKRLFAVFFICLGSWCYAQESDGGAPMEKAELDALYNAVQGFVGNWWNGSDLYPDPCGWTPIQGVACDIYDGLWYITALNIGPTHDNSLACDPNAEFRQQLFELKHLKALSFINCFTSTRRNSVSLSSGDWLKLAGNLESLEFRSNTGLTGKIPAILGNLENLQSLVLLENRLVGEIPENFGNLVKLKRLVLAGNSLSGQITQSLGRLSELLILDLSRNSLSGSLSPTLGNLTSLLKLDLSNNQLDGNLPSEISGMRSLTLLDLSNNSFSGGLRKSLFENMNSLEEVILSNNPLGGELKSLEWKNLKKLVILDLSAMELEGEIPESLSELKRLRYLGLNNNNLTGIPTPKLENLPFVSAMYLNGNKLAGDLKFSERFYGKMGRRFGAWDNPNLCYPMEMVAANKAPYGVKPCQEQEELRLVKPNSKASLDGLKWNFVAASKGCCSSYGIGSSESDWLVILVKTLMVVLLFNIIIFM